MKKIYLETYGCQMNEYDSELVKSILKKSDYQFTDSTEDADIVLLNTCSIRENANRKIYNRISQIQHARNGNGVKIGILGCMATNFPNSMRHS